MVLSSCEIEYLCYSPLCLRDELAHEHLGDSLVFSHLALRTLALQKNTTALSVCVTSGDSNSDPCAFEISSSHTEIPPCLFVF